jgi:malonyl-CoA decarboxylase
MAVGSRRKNQDLPPLNRLMSPVRQTFASLYTVLPITAHRTGHAGCSARNSKSMPIPDSSPQGIAGNAEGEPSLPSLVALSGAAPKRATAPVNEAHGVRSLIERIHVLLSEQGTISGRTLANEVLTAYEALNGPELVAFFDRLVVEFSPDPEIIMGRGDAYRLNPSHANLVQLQSAVESPLLELFQRLNLARGGTTALVEMRRRLLRGLKENRSWAAAESELARLLGSWFNAGFLELRRIDWRTPPPILEWLVEHEAVHQITGWRDLKRRLQDDRRCFGFFHPSLPDQPVVFVELALTSKLSAEVQPLLDPDSAVADAASCSCAMFYSISICHDGLEGLGIGNALLRRVIDALSFELPRIRTFATISPIPGFVSWLTGQMRDDARDSSGVAHLVAKLEAPDWFQHPGRSAAIAKEILPLCAFYLLRAKRGHEPADSVARFHLGNGARLARLNWLGDTSAAGIRRSAGVTANYIYRLAELERNHQAYVADHTVIASRRLEALVRGVRR